MMISKTKHNNQEEQQELQQKKKIIQVIVNMSKRDSLTHSEYFEDDENKADRFTDDYREDQLIDIYLYI